MFREIVLDASVTHLPSAPEVPANHIEDPADEHLDEEELEPFRGFERPPKPPEVERNNGNGEVPVIGTKTKDLDDRKS